MWYLFALISLYWITPLLRKIAESGLTTEYFLQTGFIFTFLVGRVLNFVSLLNLPHADVLASLQSRLRSDEPPTERCFRCMTMFWASMFISTVQKALSDLCRRSHRLARHAGADLLAFPHRQARSAPSLLQCVARRLAMTSAIFVFFKDLHFHLGEIGKTLIFASKCTASASIWCMPLSWAAESILSALRVCSGLLYSRRIACRIRHILRRFRRLEPHSQAESMDCITDIRHPFPPQFCGFLISASKAGEQPDFFRRFAGFLILFRIQNRISDQFQRRTGVQIQPAISPRISPVEMPRCQSSPRYPCRGWAAASSRRIPAFWHLSFIVLRSPELLATPPANATVFARFHRGGHRLSLSSSTAACWKLAAISAAGILPVLAQLMHRVDERGFQPREAVIIASRRLHMRQLQRMRISLAARLIQQRSPADTAPAHAPPCQMLRPRRRPSSVPAAYTHRNRPRTIWLCPPDFQPGRQTAAPNRMGNVVRADMSLNVVDRDERACSRHTPTPSPPIHR